MTTVTIGQSYFQALLRRAEFHTAGHEFDTTPSLSSNVTISKSEHDYLTQALRDLNQLKQVLFRGGLTAETLDTLLTSESEAPDEPCQSSWEDTFAQSNTLNTSSSPKHHPPKNTRVASDKSPQHVDASVHGNAYSFGPSTSSSDMTKRDDSTFPFQRVPVHDQRTILISNLADRTTHKDIVSIIRGGRLLDIFLRHDRTATVSFVEGAAEFLAYTKHNDIYLLQKRLEFCWNDRQFRVPPHVSSKIANGASRNLVVHGAYGKLTAEEIRNHLDHIHNLVVIDIHFKDGNAYIFTNSIHNALFAKTCCMSRSVYKGLRLDWHPDECAAPLPPKKVAKLNTCLSTPPVRSRFTTNRYTLLDTEWDDESVSESSSSVVTDSIFVARRWAGVSVA